MYWLTHWKTSKDKKKNAKAQGFYIEEEFECLCVIIHLSGGEVSFFFFFFFSKEKKKLKRKKIFLFGNKKILELYTILPNSNQCVPSPKIVYKILHRIHLGRASTASLWIKNRQYQSRMTKSLKNQSSLHTLWTPWLARGCRLLKMVSAPWADLPNITSITYIHEWWPTCSASRCKSLCIHTQNGYWSLLLHTMRYKPVNMWQLLGFDVRGRDMYP